MNSKIIQKSKLETICEYAPKCCVFHLHNYECSVEKETCHLYSMMQRIIDNKYVDNTGLCEGRLYNNID
jgi:hypothetical protein